MKELSIERNRRQPRGPSAGSVFVNPDGVSAGALIEESGLKGLVVGGATVSEKHANFILTDKECSAADVQELIKLVGERVLEDSGKVLECEIQYLGPNGISQI